MFDNGMIWQLCTYIRWVQQKGDYCGNKKSWDKTHLKIIKTFSDMLRESGWLEEEINEMFELDNVPN